jgi:hypothetical protein
VLIEAQIGISCKFIKIKIDSTTKSVTKNNTELIFSFLLITEIGKLSSFFFPCPMMYHPNTHKKNNKHLSLSPSKCQ